MQDWLDEIAEPYFRTQTKHSLKDWLASPQMTYGAKYRSDPHQGAQPND